MGSMPIRPWIVGMAGLLAASAITEASAASRQKRVAPAQKSEQSIQPPGAMRPPTPPGGCVLDEGYGRYRPCSGGTGGGGGM